MELGMEWLFSLLEETHEDDELACALTLPLKNSEFGAKGNLRLMKLTTLIKMICWLRVSGHLIHVLKFLLGLVRLQIPKKSRMLLKSVRGTLKSLHYRRTTLP